MKKSGKASCRIRDKRDGGEGWEELKMWRAYRFVQKALGKKGESFPGAVGCEKERMQKPTDPDFWALRCALGVLHVCEARAQVLGKAEKTSQRAFDKISRRAARWVEEGCKWKDATANEAGCWKTEDGTHIGNLEVSSFSPVFPYLHDRKMTSRPPNRRADGAIMKN